ncbi:MAG TPA: hypothetical protein VHM91_15360 [Verrucomicrobiales bacterium]|nr:hypothetical protein [Verrucomicrobiales bacterium]
MKKLIALLAFIAAPAVLPLRAEPAKSPDAFALLGEKLAKAIPKAPAGAEAARFVPGADNNRLQVPRFQYTGPAGEKIELTGAIHIADRAYYERLNKHFQSFDAVLFEMVANPDRLEAMRKKVAAPAAQAAPEKENPLREIYRSLSKDILKMPFQPEVVDYAAANFIHADVSEDELEKMFKDKGLEMSRVMSGGASVSQMRLVFGLVKMLTPSDDPHAMKRLFAPLFGSIGAGFAGQKEVEEIIITRRNDRAMEVLERELAAGKKNLSLFYGSAHLADFGKRLEAKGWKKTGEVWEDAWVFPASKPAAEPAK